MMLYGQQEGREGEAGGEWGGGGGGESSTYAVSIASISFLQPYLQGHGQCVFGNDTHSQEASITSGVPQ